MAEHSRYKVTAKQADIEKGVLKNKLNIVDQKTLNDTETILLHDTYAHFVEILENGSMVFDIFLLFDIHKYFLNTLYSWDGKIREVDISKDGMLFASCKYINSAIAEFEKDFKNNIPKKFDSKKIFAQKLATVHTELNAIHPFRDGNGRTIRLFLDLIALNSGYQSGHTFYCLLLMRL